jgi:acyl carrier protein
MNNRAYYSDTIKEFIIDNFLFGEKDKLKDDIHLFESGIIDSTGILELVAFIEDNFNIRVKDDELIITNFFSLQAITGFIEAKMPEMKTN